MKELLELKELPKGHVSPSQLQTLLTCPKRYEFRYVKDIKVPPHFALAIGSSGHITVQQSLYDEYIRKKSNEYFIETLKELEKEEEFDKEKKPKSEIEKDIEEFSKAIHSYTNYSPNYLELIDTEKTIEKEVKINFDEYTLLMYLDVETEKQIIDWKFTSRKPTSIPFSLMVYKAFNEKDLFAHYITKKNENYIIEVFHKKEVILEEVKKLIMMLKTGIFPRNPGFQDVNCRLCGYKELCEPPIMEVLI